MCSYSKIILSEQQCIKLQSSYRDVLTFLTMVCCCPGISWRKKQKYTGRNDLTVLKNVKQRVIKLPCEMRTSSMQFKAV